MLRHGAARSVAIRRSAVLRSSSVSMSVAQPILLTVSSNGGIAANHGGGAVTSLESRQRLTTTGGKPHRMAALALVHRNHHRVILQSARHGAQGVALDQGQISRQNQPTIALLRFLTQIGGSGSLWGLTAAHTVIVLPYVLRLVAAATGFDRSIAQAAQSLGASALTVFRRIELPLIVPGGWHRSPP